MPAAWIAGMPVVGAVAALDWRAAWLAVPMVAALATLALLRLRPADARSTRSGDAVGAWRRPEVARFALGELLANAAWASVLTYAGALLLDSYGLSPGAVALASAPSPWRCSRGRSPPVATRPGRRPRCSPPSTACRAPRSSCSARYARPPVTLAIIAPMAFVNGWRSLIASALGMDRAPRTRSP